MTVVASDLTNPSINLEMGQSYIEMLRDQPFTSGLLPKVIAAYNAGPLPVSMWNATVKDDGDPLLWIESIPYWETRGYVMTVLRNYWMYERQLGTASPSREALAHGLWPRFPGLPGGTATRAAARPIGGGVLASAD
jgi:soluble lytic murein transglycosylase-like protein